MNDQVTNAVDAINDQLLKNDPNEGRLMALKFTPDGEVPIVRRLGKDVEEPLAEEPFKGTPSGWKQKHSEAVYLIYVGVSEINKKKRQIPLLREEAIALGVSKAMLKDLEGFGIVTQRLLKILDKRRGMKATGGRMVVYFTPQGRAYVQEAFKKERERQENVQAVSGSSESGQQTTP